MSANRFRPFRRIAAALMVFAVCFPVAAIAQSQTYKQLPPAGIKVDAAKITALEFRIRQLEVKSQNVAAITDDDKIWRPDVEVLLRAVRLAIDQNLFFKESEPAAAIKLLDEAQRRLAAVVDQQRGLSLLGLAAQKTDQPQLLVGGFVSVIDDSVQPYGLVIPAGFDPAGEKPLRLDIWLHGRGDTKTEIPFLVERMTKVGQCAPADTIVLHPFGRHCNAFKFAGERDVYESLEHVQSLVPIDRGRVSIRGFSMGGAGCWHFAVHDPARWFAVNPGAGFVDTIVYQGWQDKMPYPLTEAGKKLMQWYDVLPWTANLTNTRTIAYSGETDKQKQAADRVYEQSQKLGLEWPYVIGAKMGHKIDAASQQTIDAQLAQWAAEEVQSPRKKIDFVTYTVRYGKADWLEVTGLQEHWSAGRVKAEISGDQRLKIETDGITHLRLDFAQSGWADGHDVGLVIDGERFLISDSEDRRGLQCNLARDKQWTQLLSDLQLRKRPGLQGPIDDAFCDRFLFVLPSRPAKHGVVQRWIDREVRYAKRRWRRLMRGEIRSVLDTELTATQVAENNLICFGDYASNRYLFSIATRLPVEWNLQQVKVGEQKFDPSFHAPVFCVPNPQNPSRYLVVNSGMTFREFSNVSNSRQIAMLPDWAVLDVSEKDDGIFAGKVVAEGFFNEQWQLP